MAESLDKTGENISMREEALIRPNVAYPCLEILTGPGEGMTIPLKTGEFIIGRSKENPIHLDDTSVSRAHSRLLLEKDRIVIRDLASRNGTYVNGKKIAENEEHPLNHLDQVKIGIYLFRLLTKAPTPAEEEEARRREEARSSKAATFVAEPDRPDEPAGKAEPDQPVMEIKDDSFDRKNALIVPPDMALRTDSPRPDELFGSRPNFLRIIFVVVCMVSALAGLAYFLYPGNREKQDQKEGVVEPVQPADEAPSAPVAPAQPTVTEPAKQLKSVVLPQVSAPDQVVPKFNVFLDVTSQPTTARVFLEGKPIGQTPFKVSVPVETGKEYELTAEFDLKDVRDRYQQKLSFKADPRKEVVPLAFSADIGVIKIQKLPRQVSFYLEGYYAYDKYKANPVRLTDIIYGKPIYVPFGSYLIELREKTRVGDSNTYVDEIRYHRQFEVNAGRKVIELAVNERDLQFFPAHVQSVPSGADLYFDGEKLGMTPYTGELPLGKHELKLVKEGYFDNVMPLDMRTNTQFEAKIDLKTSKAGEFINRAREYRHEGQYQQAINELVEALKLETAGREKAEIHLLLGDSYAMMRNNENALTYFEQAKAHPDFYYRAMVGLARVQLTSGNRSASLTSLVEVFLNITDADPLKKEALSVFKQLSPLKSVVYVSTEPAGATVYVNNQEVQQKTPVIVSDLALGNYRIEVQKTGFEPQQIRKNLKLTEFVPIIIKLKPQKL